MSVGIKQALMESQKERFQGRRNIRENVINGVSKMAGLMKGTGLGGLFVEKGVKLLMRSGLPDKLTGGKTTRFLTGLYRMFKPNEGVKSEYGNNVAEVSRFIGNGTKSIVQTLNKNV